MRDRRFYQVHTRGLDASNDFPSFVSEPTETDTITSRSSGLSEQLDQHPCLASKLENQSACMRIFGARMKKRRGTNNGREVLPPLTCPVTSRKRRGCTTLPRTVQYSSTSRRSPSCSGSTLNRGETWVKNFSFALSLCGHYDILPLPYPALFGVQDDHPTIFAACACSYFIETMMKVNYHRVPYNSFARNALTSKIAKKDSSRHQTAAALV